MAGHVVLDESVEGTRVINAQGEEVGVVSGVRGGVAYVDPGIADGVVSTLGWHDIDEDHYPLPEASIERITDDEIHIRKDV